MPARFGATAAFGALLCGCSLPSNGPLEPHQALEAFKTATGFRVELFASEPHVVDPVEMVFDEYGGVYVAEMRDNPDDPEPGMPPLSRIKYLEDSDGDGRIDRHTVFADRLLAVEGIAPWRGGLIATAAPDILFLKDTDGDHRADVREVLYTGFALAHVEGRLSNPRLGLDNWFYVVNHRSPGTVTAPGRPAMAPVNVRNREFRFHPVRELAEASPGDAQFGQSQNRWGHWFITHNTVHLRHVVISPGYLDRNHLLAVEDAEQDISDHGQPAARVFPISEPQQWRVERTRARQRRYEETSPGRVEQLAGYFSAAAGSTVYHGDRFGPEFEDAVFVGEGNGNLVHCDFTSPHGATYTARRWPAGSDFLASTDNWFRPVNFANAPDGNLYLLDYYREFHEHPDFIPEPIQRRLRMDFRAGDDRGRIYRIIPDESPWEARPVALGDLTSEGLADLIDHPNGWHRETAHRLLLERQDRGAVDRLTELARNHADPAVRLRSLWVLEGLDSLNPELVRSAFGDPHPAVRETALRIAEPYLADFVEPALLATGDESARVAFQAGLTIGGLPLGSGVVQSLAGLLARFPDDPWFHAAVLSARPDLGAPVLEALADKHPVFFGSASRERLRLVRRMVRIVGTRNDQAEIDRILGLVVGTGVVSHPEWSSAALNGLADGLSLHGKPVGSPRAVSALGALLQHEAGSVRSSAAKLAPFFALESVVRAAKNLAGNISAPLSRRLVAASVLQAGTFEDVAPSLEAFLLDHSEGQLRARACRVLAAFPDARASDILLQAWEVAPPELRDVMADAMLRRSGHALKLVQAVGNGQVSRADIPAIALIRLSQHPDEAVRAAVERHLGSGLPDRASVLAERLSVLELRGDARAGKPLFERECASCHVARASRARVGPSLAGVANRSREDLLTSILDPSYSIEDRYRNHLLETRDGRFHDGILVAETSATLTLRGEREDISVFKRDVADLRISMVSLMPEGFEDTFSDKQLADLIAYLQAGL